MGHEVRSIENKDTIGAQERNKERREKGGYIIIEEGTHIEDGI